jgi:pimeloyl-ACP methyl ester carboxylesterase
MKKKYVLLILVLVSFAGYGQNSDPKDEFAKAREIIADLDSIVTPNGVQEYFQAEIGGIQQWVFTRGMDLANPVILFVHGGPASPMAPVSWMFQRPLEEYFTVVNYDQRAAGKTYADNDTLGLGSTIRISQYVDDAIELAEMIKKRYGKKKIILMGHSWGTIVSMHAALNRPDLFHAYIGIGQVINTLENERLSFEFGIREAKRHDNHSALEELMSIAPYPGKEPVTRERIITARKWPQFYGGLSAYRNDSRYYFQGQRLSPLYGAGDVKAINQGSLFTLERILPEFLAVDFTGIRNFPIPVFMLLGRHDYTTPSEPTVKWLQNVQAPAKKGIWFEHSAHLIPLEEPGKFLLTLVNEVRPLALEPELPGD